MHFSVLRRSQRMQTLKRSGLPDLSRSGRHLTVRRFFFLPNSKAISPFKSASLHRSQCSLDLNTMEVSLSFGNSSQFLSNKDTASVWSWGQKGLFFCRLQPPAKAKNKSMPSVVLLTDNHKCREISQAWWEDASLWSDLCYCPSAGVNIILSVGAKNFDLQVCSLRLLCLQVVWMILCPSMKYKLQMLGR